MQRKGVYPFSAIVGQEKMKKALLLNVVNPAIGGVLIQGEKGTAKSTAVRALAALLPALPAIAHCVYHCDPADERSWCSDCESRYASTDTTAGNGERIPTTTVPMRVVELPVSATEDRVVGMLDMEYAIKEGKKKFERGILAEANRNILYVDEINLLDDHVVDVLLDAAAMGVNTVEREGISYSHPAHFVLVGTMNPEEGDIRPQLLDRFGLSVRIAGEQDATDRVTVVQRRLAYESDPVAFCKSYEIQDSQIAEQVEKARRLLPQVTVPVKMYQLVAHMAIELGIEGHRADITVIKTAMTVAALAGRTEVEEADIREAVNLALPHRMRRRPFEQSTLSETDIDSLMQHAQEQLDQESMEQDTENHDAKEAKR